MVGALLLVKDEGGFALSVKVLGSEAGGLWGQQRDHRQNLQGEGPCFAELKNPSGEYVDAKSEEELLRKTPKQWTNEFSKLEVCSGKLRR